MRKVCIIGGGISGLTTAYLLKDKFDVSLFENTHRFGGYIQTFRKSGYVIDIGPSSLSNNEPRTTQLIEKLGLTPQVVTSKEDAKVRYLFTDDKLQAFPNTPEELLTSGLFPISSKLKIAAESFLSPQFKDEFEHLSITEFLKLYFDDYIANTIARTYLLGIFGGDSKKLNIGMSIPKLVKLVRENKSILKSLKKNYQINGPAKSLNLKNGLESIVDTLAKEIKNKHAGNEIQRILKTSSGYKVQIHNSDRTYDKDFDIVIITSHSQQTYSWLQEMDPQLKLIDFGTINYAPFRVIALGFKEKLKFKGSGALIDPDSNKNILGFLHPTDIFDGRSPQGKDSLIITMGGVFKPEVLKMSLERSVEMAITDLKSILGELPPLEFAQVVNHSPGIIQYENENIEKFKLIESHFKNTKGLYLNSIIQGGISVDDCIRKSFELCEKLLEEEAAIPPREQRYSS